MTLWLVLRSIRHAPRRFVLGGIGVAFPVAMLAATLLFVDYSVHSMTKVALGPVQVEQKALATSLDQDVGAVSHKLETVRGVKRADRFAAADVIVGGGGARATARLIAVDPAYLRHHPFAHIVRGRIDQGALLNQKLFATPGFSRARRVSIEVPGQGRPLRLSQPVGGVVDVREATSWFEIPAGDVQGDVAMVPRSIVIDYATFERDLLPALRARVGTTTPVLNPDLADLPPVSLESHITVDHDTYPPEPGRAALWSQRLRKRLERQATGKILVADNAFEVLTEAKVDAADAKILFLLLGIPGVLVAAALGVGAESALAEAHRREDALLRLRGATAAQLARLASASAVVSGLAGTALGLVAAGAAVSAVIGHAVWHDSSAGRLIASALLAALAGALTTGVRLFRLVRVGERSEVVDERRVLEAGWNPAWRRVWLDLILIAGGLAILGINLANGGLKQTPIQGPSVALSFYVLLAPVALWLGTTLLMVRGLLALSARRARPERARPLGSWGGAAMRWLARRPARTAVALVLGTLAVAFATEVVTFVATYREAKRADAHASFGSDMRLIPAPADVPPQLPPLGKHVAATTPIRYVGARVGTDRKTILTVDPGSYDQATSVSPQILEGGGFRELARAPGGVLISKELADDEEVKPGEKLPLTIFPDDDEKKRNVTPRIIGIYRSFPPSSPVAELVMSTAGFRPYLLPEPDYYLARTIAGHPTGAVADELRRGPVKRIFDVTARVDPNRPDQRSLATLNLTGLNRIESFGAGLIAAVGVAVLGAFMVLERRREFAILRAIGTDGRRLVDGPAREGMIAVLGSLAAGVPLGLGLGILAVRVLKLFFTLPPPVVTLPGGPLLAFVLVMVAASALALGWALAAVTRVEAAEVLREP
jgi:putative ABC transport system permease protein